MIALEEQFLFVSARTKLILFCHPIHDQQNNHWYSHTSLRNFKAGTTKNLDQGDITNDGVFDPQLHQNLTVISSPQNFEDFELSMKPNYKARIW